MVASSKAIARARIMPEQYPFVLANTRIGALLDSISTAARPPKFSQEFLRTLGFTSSADRAFVPLFRSLGLINDSGVPTEAYDRLRDRRVRAQVLADRIRDLYADLFAIRADSGLIDARLAHLEALESAPRPLGRLNLIRSFGYDLGNCTFSRSHDMYWRLDPRRR